MKLLLTFDGIGDRVVAVDRGAPVKAIVEAVGGPPGSSMQIARTSETLGPDDRVDEVDLRSGDRVRLTSRSPQDQNLRSPAGTIRRPAAILRVVSGPGAPAAVELGFGRFTVGRGADCDVLILDEAMSRHHADIVVDDDSVEIVDAGSSNGVIVDGVRRSGPTTLLDDTMALLGETWVRVEHLRRGRGLSDVGEAAVKFNRPPRVVQPYKPTTTKVPVPPDHPPKQRIPKISAVAPLLMGLGMVYLPVLAGGQPNFLFGAFMIFSPIMLVGSYLENRSATRVNHREALAEFNSQLAEVQVRLDELSDDEQRGRTAAAPASSQLQHIVDSLSPRLWERAPEDSDMMSVRVGLADLPAQNKLEMHDQGPRDLRVEIEALPERYGTVKDVPLVVDLKGERGVGLSGPQEFSLPLAFSIVGQLATLHSPAELLLAAMVPGHARDAWEWMKWLPHCPDESIIGGRPLAADEAACRSLLNRLLALIETRLEERSQMSGNDALVTPAIAVVVAEGLPVEQNELTRLLELGPKVGVFTVWISAAHRRVPRSLGAVVHVDNAGAVASVGTTRTGETIEGVAFESMTRFEVETLARSLSPVEDVGAYFSSASQVPSRVSLVELLGGESVLEKPDSILEHWKERPKTLEAPVGRLADGVFTLDIRRDGPHALVGGTTGAGKSEFLQSWIMAMAATHSPETVTFLLVDYKGGAAFKDCAKLPHTVGMVTDLNTAGVRRALVSLRAELHHREHLFADNDCSDLLEMIDKKIPGTPPSLLIIVDEFAALVQEVPEFVDGMVDVAQRGRSLGLHLVLATQRPAGVITPQVRANTDLRIALRMADAEDSTDVIDVPDAADIDRKIPGRAIARISRDRFNFQSAYVGGVTDDDSSSVPTVELASLEFGASVPLAVPSSAPPVSNDAVVPTDLERLVTNIDRVHTSTGEPLPRKPWLEPLRPVYDLADLDHPDDDSRLLLGMVDRPERQSQETLWFDPDQDGSAAVVGTGGSGKTVLLRTVAASVGLHRRSPLDLARVYGIDFGGRGLRMLECLPQVATIAYEDEVELIRRLLADLEATLDGRVEQFSTVRASSVEEYRAARPDHGVERIYLLIDNYPSFHEMFEPLENERFIRLVRRIILEGRQVGMHVVLTAPRRDAVAFAVSRAIGRWIPLRQVSDDEYRSLEIPADVLDESSPPGRAIEGDSEAQVAILGGNGGSDEQGDALQSLADRLSANGAGKAAPVRLLPTSLERLQLSDPRAIGIRDSDFAEQRLPDRLRVFMIAGPRSSGRSTVATTVASSLSGGFDEVHWLAMKRPAVKLDPAWNAAIGQEAIDEIIYTLLGESDTRRLVVMDDAFSMHELGIPVEQLAEQADGQSLAAVVVMEDNRARSGYDPFVRSVTAHKLGILLRPSPLEDHEVYGLAMPRIKSHLWPAGRGYYVDGQSMDAVQVASMNVG